MPTDTLPITSASNDGGGSKVSATWAGVPGASYNVSDAASDSIGKSLFAGDFYSFLIFLRFDTSAIPGDATITGAGLILDVIDRASPDGISIAADYYDFGGTPSVAADWEQSSSGDAISAFTILSLTNGAVNTIPLTSLVGINLSGFTGLRVAAANTVAPTGDNYAECAMFDHATRQEPRLQVTYTVGSAGTPQLTADHGMGMGRW